MEANQLITHAVHALVDKKATRLVLLDVQGISDLCDYQLICSGSNERQTRAIAEGVKSELSKQGKIKPFRSEGIEGGNWILLDYGDLSVHIFYEEHRDHYALEEIWSNAKTLTIPNHEPNR